VNPDIEVLHGYTLGNLHSLAKMAVNWSRSRAADYADRLDTAQYGVSEYLCAAGTPPRPWDLIHAGADAVDRMIAGELRQHGNRYRDAYNGPESAPGYWRFWWDQAVPAPSCENKVVDKVALGQIWPRLRERHREALAALAAFGDYQLAAKSMGIAPGTFNVHVSHARKAFLALWHEGEEPSRPWGTDRRRDAGPGGPKRPATKAVTRRAGRPVHELVHGRASTYANHACRCAPCTEAATAKARESRRANGTQVRKTVTAEQKAQAAALRAEGRTWAQVGAALGVSGVTAIRAVNGREPARKTAAV
jgi:hypothetical protein